MEAHIQWLISRELRPFAPADEHPATRLLPVPVHGAVIAETMDLDACLHLASRSVQQIDSRRLAGEPVEVVDLHLQSAIRQQGALHVHLAIVAEAAVCR